MTGGGAGDTMAFTVGGDRIRILDHSPRCDCPEAIIPPGTASRLAAALAWWAVSCGLANAFMRFSHATGHPHELNGSLRLVMSAPGAGQAAAGSIRVSAVWDGPPPPPGPARDILSAPPSAGEDGGDTPASGGPDRQWMVSPRTAMGLAWHLAKDAAGAVFPRLAARVRQK